MSVKRDFLSNPTRYHYIASFDFMSVLSMEDASMLAYMIDLDDFKHADGGFIEVTPSYVQIKRPHWKTKTIRRALASLVEQGLLKFNESSGRGNYYAINIDAIYSLEERFNEIPKDEEYDQYTMQLDEAVLPIGETALPNRKSGSLNSQPGCRNRQAASPNRQHSITNQEHINNNSITNKNNTGAIAPGDIKYNQKVTNKEYIELSKNISDYLNDIIGSKPDHFSSSTQKQIISLLKSGYSLQDIKDVILYKYNEWGKNPIRFSNGHMSDEYLTPKTLFGKKFQMYSVQAKKNSEPEELTDVIVYEEF